MSKWILCSIREIQIRIPSFGGKMAGTEDDLAIQASDPVESKKQATSGLRQVRCRFPAANLCFALLGR